jgi:hypothetical protein
MPAVSMIDRNGDHRAASTQKKRRQKTMHVVKLRQL